MYRPQHLSFQVLITSFLRVLGALSYFVFSLFLTNILPQNDVGIFFLLFSIVSFLAVFSRFGIDQRFLRLSSYSYLSNDFNGFKSYFLSGFVLVFITSFALSFILFTFSESIAIFVYKSSELSPLLQLFSPSICLLSLIVFISTSLQSSQRFFASVFILNISFYLFSSIFILISSDLNLYNIVLFFLFSLFLSIVLGIVFLPRSVFKCDNFSFTFKPLYSSIQALWIVSLVISLIQWAPIFIAGFFVSNSDLALLGVSQRVSLLVSLVILGVNVVSGPKFSFYFKNNQHSLLKKYFIKALLLSSIFGFFSSFFLFIFSEDILFLFGSSYSINTFVINSLILAQFVNSVTGPVALFSFND